MKNIKTYLLLFIAIISYSFSLAQEQSVILKNYIEEGLKSSLVLQKEQLSINKGMRALEEAKGLFRPSVSFDASYTIALGGRSLNFPIGDLLNPIYGTLNQLTQTNQFPTDIENVNEQFLPNNFQETKLRMIYPIINRDIYYNYKAKQEAISISEAQKKVYEAELKKDIEVAYYRYLQSLEALKIYRETRGLLKEILRVNKKLVKYEKATKDIVYAAEYEINKIDNEILQAEKNESVARAYFNFLLNRDLTAIVEVDENLPVDIVALSSINDLLAENIADNRSELQQLKGALAVNEQLIGLQEAGKYPKLNLVVDAGFQGNGYNIFDNQAFGLAQISLSWNIYDAKQRKSRLQQAKIQGEMYSTQYLDLQRQLNLQIFQAGKEVEAAQAKVAVDKTALKSAQATFNLLKKKYEAGNGYFYELVEARTRLTTAKIAIVLSKYELMMRTAELNRTLEK